MSCARREEEKKDDYFFRSRLARDAFMVMSYLLDEECLTACFDTILRPRGSRMFLYFYVGMYTLRIFSCWNNVAFDMASLGGYYSFIRNLKFCLEYVLSLDKKKKVVTF